MTLREQLLELTEPKYMKFTSALMPGVENVLGIRLPVLRSIAKEIAAGDWRAYLAEADRKSTRLNSSHSTSSRMPSSA